MRFSVIYLAYLLALAAVLFSVIGVSSRLIEKKTVRIAEETIAAGMEKLKITLASYDRAGMTLMNMPMFRLASADMLHSLYDKYEAHQLFRSIILTLENQPSCGLILHNGTLIVAGRYYESPGMYFDTILYCDEYPSFDAWRAHIREAAIGRFVPALHYTEIFGDTTEAVLYLVDRTTSDELFYVLIPTRRIEEILLPASNVLRGNLTLSVAGGNHSLVLYQSSPFSPEACAHSVEVSGGSNLRVRLDIPQSVIDAEMREARTGFYLFAMAFILIGLVLSFVMACHNTRPIAVLMNAAAELERTGHTPEPDAQLHREYRYLLSVLSNSGEALEAYERELRRYAEETRYWAFVGMLTGDAAEMPLELEHAPYTLLMLRGKAPDCDAGSLLLSVVRSCLDRADDTRTLCAMLHQTVILLICEAQYAERKRGICAALGEIPGMELRQIAIASLYRAEEIRDAYAQASYMLSLSAPGAAASQETELLSQTAGRMETPDKLTCFSASGVSHLLLSGQIDVLVRMFDDCIRFFRDGGYARETTVRYVYDACVTSIAIASDKYPGIVSADEIPDYSRGISVEELLMALKTSMLRACEQLRTYYESGSMAKTNEIMEYIDENIANPGLYIKLVTSHFGISDAELQNHVRNASGLSFFGYVEKHRMAQARRMVLGTDESIAQISIRCGYNSSFTFTRAFTRYYGIAPSKMRSGISAGV